MTLVLILYGWSAGLANVDNLAGTASTLVLLIAGVLIYRTFRERYLFFWIVGWSSYLLYQIALERAAGQGFAPASVVLAHTAFLIAAALFAASVFDYLNRPRWFVLVAISSMLAMIATSVDGYLGLNSALLRWSEQILYRVGTFSAAILLLRHGLGRRQLSACLLAAMLFLLHVDADIARTHEIEQFDVLVESLLGLSLLLLVLDESRTRTRRLDVIHEVINAMASAEDEHVVMLAALQQVKRLMGAKASWFRMMSGNILEMRAHVGLSDGFLRTRWRIAVEQWTHDMIEPGRPILLNRRTARGEMRQSLIDEKLDHILLIPVQGKASIIGVMVVGFSNLRYYKPDELDFLIVAARQLGTAIENLQLISKILRSQRQWANTFDAMPDPIFVHDENFVILKANRALLNKLGAQPAVVAGRPCEAVLPRFGSQWNDCPYCGAETSEFRDQPDPSFGGYAIVSTTTYTGDQTGPGGTVHVIRDTTARRAAEERYRTLFEQVQEGVFVSTPDGRVVDCNDTFVQMLGYNTREEVLAKDIAQSFYAYPSDRNVFLQKMAKQGLVRNFEVNLRRKDGSILTVLENSYATKTPSGNIVRYHGVLLDITEKKRAEDEIRRRNRELESLNAIAVLASQSFDLDEIINVALRQLVEIFSADTASIYLLEPERHILRRAAAFGHRSEIGTSLQTCELPERFLTHLVTSRIELLTHRNVPKLPDKLNELVVAEGLQSWIWVVMWSAEKMVGVLGVNSRTEDSFNERDESLMIALGRQLATSVEKIRLYEETSKAYDHLRRTQEQLLQSEKMSAVGQLISGVAHELNNPLTAILGYAQLLEGEQLTDHQKEFVGKMYKQAQRTHRVVQNLLSFARQRKPAKMPVDLRRIVDDTIALREYDLNLHNVVIQRHYDETLPAVVADPHQLEQVFLNITNNAVDAMLEHSKGGRLNVTVTQHGGTIMLEFHDSGPGIKEVNRIFDPFYTTKGVGKGTGLGLSICYGIIKEHGGDIRAYNHPAGGAVVQIVLPVAATAMDAPKQEQPRGRAVPLQGRVLLVDDEEAVLEFEREVLMGAGAEVVCLNSGEAAIDRLGKEQFDAILVDSSMPGALNGIDVYKWLEEHKPESKASVIVVFSSLADSDLRQYVDANSIRHIVKPFEVSDLIAITGRVIAEARPATAR